LIDSKKNLKKNAGLWIFFPQYAINLAQYFGGKIEKGGK
jgi:hypothetical protein